MSSVIFKAAVFVGSQFREKDVQKTLLDLRNGKKNEYGNFPLFGILFAGIQQ